MVLQTFWSLGATQELHFRQSSKLIQLDSVILTLVFESDKQAFLTPVEPQTHLVVLIADVAHPISAIVLSHGTDQGAADFVEALILAHAGLEGLRGISELLVRNVPTFGDNEVIDGHSSRKLEPRSHRLSLTFSKLHSFTSWAEWILYGRSSRFGKVSCLGFQMGWRNKPRSSLRFVFSSSAACRCLKSRGWVAKSVLNWFPLESELGAGLFKRAVILWARWFEYTSYFWLVIHEFATLETIKEDFKPVLDYLHCLSLLLVCGLCKFSDFHEAFLNFIESLFSCVVLCCFYVDRVSQLTELVSEHNDLFL